MPLMNERHYTFVRWCLGVYLVVHFVTLMPHAGELFSGQGALPDPTILPSHGFFPNPLFILSSPQSIQLFLGTMTLVAVLFSAGICTRLSAGALWFGWASLVSRNPFISNPSIPFVGLLLLFFALISNEKKDAQLLVWRGIWVIMAVAYTVSGLHKLGSPSWVDGSALAELLRNPLARDTDFTRLLGYLPPFILRMLTWGALSLEIAFAPLALCAGVGGMWKLLGFLRVFPRPLRDVGYSIIATYRHKIFPPHDVCGVLTAEDRSRFL